MAKKLTRIGRFIFNNDLSEIKFSFHNRFHFFGCMLTALIFGFPVSYSLGIAWEISDGFKPWFDKFTYNKAQSKRLNYLRENALYADGFSLQDAVVWDLAGACIGCILRWGIV